MTTSPSIIALMKSPPSTFPTHVAVCTTSLPTLPTSVTWLFVQYPPMVLSVAMQHRVPRPFLPCFLQLHGYQFNSPQWLSPILQPTSVLDVPLSKEHPTRIVNHKRNPHFSKPPQFFTLVGLSNDGQPYLASQPLISLRLEKQTHLTSS